MAALLLLKRQQPVNETEIYPRQGMTESRLRGWKVLALVKVTGDWLLTSFATSCELNGFSFQVMITTTMVVIRSFATSYE